MRVIVWVGLGWLCCGTLQASALIAESSWTHVIGFPPTYQDVPTIALDLDADGRSELLRNFYDNGSSNGYPRTQSSGLGLAQFDLAGSDPSLSVMWLPNIFTTPAAVHLPAGDLLVLPLAEGPMLRVYGGLPLRHVASYPNPDYSQPLIGGDVNADGSPDLVEADHVYPQYRLRLRDLATGSLVWSSGMFDSYTPRAKLAQLDSDAALEIIVEGTPGLVLDGATGLVDWSFAGRFDNVSTGAFDASTPLRIASSVDNRVTFFRTHPYSPIEDHDLPLYIYDMKAANLDADAQDELVMSHGYSVSVFDRTTGTSRAIATPSYVIEHLEVAQLDQDAALELVLSGRYGPNYNRGFGVIDSATETEQFRLKMPFGHAMPFVVGDLSGNGTQEVLVFSVEPGSSVEVRVLSADSGALLRRATLPTDIAMPHPGGAVAAQFDADAAMEIVLGAIDQSDDGFVLLDAATLQAQRIAPIGAGTGPNVPPAGTAIGDIDGDGDEELVTLIGDSNVRVHVYDALTGTREWRSVAAPATLGKSLVLLQADADVALEIAVWTGSSLYLYDGGTRFLEWSVPRPGPVYTSYAMQFLHFEREGECRFGLHDFEGTVFEYRCDGMTLEPLRVDQGLSSLSVAAGQVFGIRDGELIRLDLDTGRTDTLPGFLGPSAGAGAHVFAEPQADGRTRVMLANDGAVRMLGLVDYSLFGDGFE